MTTTTVEDSGLLERLTTGYHQHQQRFRLSTTAVGSGAALALGRRGDADLLLTHDPPAESAFVQAGHGVQRLPIMESEFVLAGPADDPAGVRGAKDFGTAFGKIARSGSLFISRGDDSGTHHSELELWQRAQMLPPRDSSWYVEAGAGMAETLRLGAQRNAYVLTDLPTLQHLGQAIDLDILARGKPPVPNAYSLIIPRGGGNTAGSRDFAEWLTGPGQEVIASHGNGPSGRALFEPATRP